MTFVPLCWVVEYLSDIVERESYTLKQNGIGGNSTYVSIGKH
jgi:hypothetical protein